jgi:hypothetical protein
LAHLIRKALALSQAVDAEARQLGQWLLEELLESSPISFYASLYMILN